MVAVQVVILLLECYSDGGAPHVSLYLENEIFKERNGMLRMAVRDSFKEREAGGSLLLRKRAGTTNY